MSRSSYVDYSCIGHLFRAALIQVLRLETKLRDLHASDLVATKRALTTLQQHTEALQQDSEVCFFDISQILMPMSSL